MKKRDLLKLIDHISDDQELFFVSSGYDPHDDSTWMADTQTEVSKVITDHDDVYVVLECEEFMN